MSVLELQGVSKVYGEGSAQVQALAGVDLPVDAGAMAAATGPSGSRKRTLLTIAGSLEEPTSGRALSGHDRASPGCLPSDAVPDRGESSGPGWSGSPADRAARRIPRPHRNTVRAARKEETL